MTQRPRISQLKRHNSSFKTFEEQYESLELNTKHLHKPVRTKGELPYGQNTDGAECLVIEEGVTYYWDEAIQNWMPIIGQVFELEDATFKRWKKTYIAKAGQTDFYTAVQFNVGRHEVDVYIQGLLQDVDIDYIEFDNQTIRFIQPLPVGASVTIATPMMVEQTTNVETVLQRLEDLEYNHYQLMLSQYYDGKVFDAVGMVYDGFRNTEQIDYQFTSRNVLYDSFKKSMYMRNAGENQFIEQFDNQNFIRPESDVRVANSEITLPIADTFQMAFNDDFTTNEWIDEATTAFWDMEKGLVTNHETFGRSDHYHKGDFMSTTGSADLVGFNLTLTMAYYYYYNSSVGSSHYGYENLAQQSSCYGVLATNDMIAMVNDIGIVTRTKWPYSILNYLYLNSSSYYRTVAQHSSSLYYSARAYNIFNTNNHYPRPTMAYIKGANRLYFLYQFAETGETYYQRLYYGNGNAYNIASWTACPRPTGISTKLFGSEANTFTQSRDYISQIGATKDYLLIRSEDILYFLDHNHQVVKTLDWSKSTRKPTTYNQTSQQMTADGEYLYFPARLLRDGLWGYYLEVFKIEDGSFVNEILVTNDNHGDPGTTAMAYDHTLNRLVLGQNGNQQYSLHKKGKASFTESKGHAGFLVFEAPSERLRELISKPFKTNLPILQYKLSVTDTLNNGKINYDIRFGDGAWIRAVVNTEYTWTNPKGASEVDVQIRAVLETGTQSTVAPFITAWQLFIKPYKQQATYRSIEKIMQLDGVTSGHITPTQVIPNETQMRWFIYTDHTENKLHAGRGGSFTLPDGIGKAYFSVEGQLSTNNGLLSPVIKDVKAQLFQQDEGVLYTETFQQLQDIKDVGLWATTDHGNDHYVVDVSRDGGQTWQEMTRRDVVQLTNGHLETKWVTRFTGSEVNKRLFKLRFRLQSAIEIFRYGAKLN